MQKYLYSCIIALTLAVDNKYRSGILNFMIEEKKQGFMSKNRRTVEAVRLFLQRHCKSSFFSRFFFEMKAMITARINRMIAIQINRQIPSG